MQDRDVLSFLTELTWWRFLLIANSVTAYFAYRKAVQSRPQAGIAPRPLRWQMPLGWTAWGLIIVYQTFTMGWLPALTGAAASLLFGWMVHYILRILLQSN